MTEQEALDLLIRVGEEAGPVEGLFAARYAVAQWPDEVTKLKGGIPELAAVNDTTVARLYGHWSEEQHCARWLRVTDHDIQEFSAWLRSRAD